MKKFKQLVILVAIFLLAFGTPAMNIAQASNVTSSDLVVEELEQEIVAAVDESLLSPEDPNKTVRVVIELEGTPTIEVATNKGVLYKDLAETEKLNLESAAEKEIATAQAATKSVAPSIKVLQTFTAVYKGFSAEVTASEISKIAELDGVVAIHEVTEYERPTEEPEMKYSLELVQAQKVWNNYDYKGDGMIVSVIDTGIDSTHKDMVLTDETTAALSKEDVDGLLADGTVENGAYYTAKVPFGYNYMDGNSEIRDLGPSASMHGMHVAGTVGANGDEDGIQGVAPEAQLLAMKVFGNSPEWESTFGDVYVKAIDDSIKLGADVINMSLGSVSGFQNDQDPEQKAVQRATENGVLVAISAGNSDMFASGYGQYAANQDYGLTGSPSVSVNSFGVASFENDKTTSLAFDYYIDGEKAGTSLYLLSSGEEPSKLFKGKQQLVWGGFGTAAEFPTTTKGKIALVSRGNGVNFVDKGLNAQKAGATAAIVHNNAAGTINMASDAAITIPYMSTLQNDGDIMAAALKAGKKVEIQFTGGSYSVPNPTAGKMSAFTSWGPTPNLDFKPEITAPGGEIFSTLNDNLYGSMSGTSMASPHVAGGTALIMQRIDKEFGLENADRVQFAKTLIMNTAKPVVFYEEEGYVEYASPRRQGAGLMQLANAIETEVYVQDQATKQPKVALKEIQDNKFTLTLDVTNISKEEKTFDVNLQLQSDYFVEDGGIYYTDASNIGSIVWEEGDLYTSSYDSTITIPAESTKTLTIEVDIEDSQVLLEAFENGYFVDGFVTLVDPTQSNPDLVVPFFGYNSDWNKAPIIDPVRWSDDTYYGYTGLITTAYAFVTGGTTPDFDKIGVSPNGDGSYDALIPIFSLLRNAKEIKSEVLNADKKVVRTLDTRYDVTKNYDPESPYRIYSSFAWDGYVNNKVAKDGQYYLQLRAKIDYPNAEWQTVTFPVKVDTTAPTADLTYNGETGLLTIANAVDPNNGTGYYRTQVLLNGVSKGYTTTANGNVNVGTIGFKDKLTIRVFDNVGNYFEKSFSKEEKNAPVVFITSPEYLDGFNTNEVAVTGYVTDQSQIVSIKVNGEEVAFDAKNAFSTTVTLEDGVHDIRVEATDLFGNTSQVAHRVIVDTTAPVLSTQYELTTEEETATISIKVTDNFDYMKLYVNGSETLYQDLSSPYQLNDYEGNVDATVELELGENEFVIEAYDVLGNEAVQTVTITRYEEGQTPDTIAIEKSVTEQIKAGGDITIEFPEAEEGEAVSAPLSAEVVQALANYAKPVTLTSNGTTLEVPAAVLAQIADAAAEGTVNFNLTVIPEVTKNGTVYKNVVDFEITAVNEGEATTISNFDEKVTVTLPLPADTKAEDKVAAYYIAEDGSLQYVQSKVVDGNVVFKTAHFSQFVVLENDVTFTDLADADWAKEFIESLASKTIVKGLTADEFSPNADITREQFAALIVRALDLPKADYAGTFSDVSEDSWSALEVEAAANAGIVLGSDGKFDPSANITREQMVTMVIRALKYSNEAALEGVKADVEFNDAASISDWAKDNVELAVGLGIINGIENGTKFDPAGKATRAQAAKVLYLLIEKL